MVTGMLMNAACAVAAGAIAGSELKPVDRNKDTKMMTRSLVLAHTSAGPELEQADMNSDTETETCIGDPPDESECRGTNYLRISRRGRQVYRDYILNLSLPPPPPSAPGIAPDQGSKNLSVYTTSGSIHAKIWILHDETGKSKRASMELCTDNGSIRAKVHDPTSENGNSGERPTLDINLRANYGDVYVSLPRCFRGPITIHTGNERIAFSHAPEYKSLVSEAPDARVYFVGKRPHRGKWGSGNENEEDKNVDEPLDELSVGGRNTSVRINWVGEEDLPEMKPNAWESFWSSGERLITTGRFW